MMLTTTNHKYMCICLAYELFWIKCVLDEGVSGFNRYDNGLMMMMMAYDSFSVIMILFLKWKKSKKYSFVILIRRTNKRTSFVFRFDSFVYQFSEIQMVTSSFIIMHSKTFLVWLATIFTSTELVTLVSHQKFTRGYVNFNLTYLLVI